MVAQALGLAKQDPNNVGALFLVLGLRGAEPWLNPFESLDLRRGGVCLQA